MEMKIALIFVSFLITIGTSDMFSPRKSFFVDEDPRNIFSSFYGEGAFKRAVNQRDLLKDMFDVALKKRNKGDLMKDMFSVYLKRRLNPTVSDYLKEFPTKRDEEVLYPSFTK